MSTPQRDIPGILFDHGRAARIGLPEAVFCEGKSRAALAALLEEHRDAAHPILFTRLDPEILASMPEAIRAAYDYHPLSRTAFAAPLPSGPDGTVAVVSAGTADARVTWEAARTLEYLGVRTRVMEDCGVAGLWRVVGRLDEINAADVVVVVAGLDAALASVLGGLTPRPVVAVPTSVGYGAADGGRTALAAMLVSCAQGVTVCNIDNGYGAACAAARILNGPARRRA